MDPADRLQRHLGTWLGEWPPTGPLTITTARSRSEPGWDGAVHPTVGVATPEGAVFSVPPTKVEAVAALATDLDGLRVAPGLGDALGIPGARMFDGVFRWCEAPTDLEEAGAWVPVDDPRVPAWLLPFGGEVLMAFDPADGKYVAGVGIKRHDDLGRELAVVTEERSRGGGLARRLVAQAARRILDEGGIPTYLHADANVRSAAVADAAGFPDRGWRILGAAGRPG